MLGQVVHPGTLVFFYCCGELANAPEEVNVFTPGHCPLNDRVVGSADQM